MTLRSCTVAALWSSQVETLSWALSPQAASRRSARWKALDTGEQCSTGGVGSERVTDAARGGDASPREPPAPAGAFDHRKARREPHRGRRRSRTRVRTLVAVK